MEKSFDALIDKEQFEFEYNPIEEKMLLNFGPSHPATHGTLRLVMELDGEVVVKVSPELGYLHHGFEKLGEHRTYNQVVTITDRMNYVSPLNNNFSYILAVEKLFGIEVSERVQYFRMILAELSRIGDHLVCMGTQGVDLGAYTPFLYLWKEREKIYYLFEIISGTRLTVSYARIGGVPRDRDEIPPIFFRQLDDYLENFGATLAEVDRLLTRNKIWLNRTKDVGVISKEDVFQYGLTGPVMRASGVEWDIRVAEPYSLYETVDFEIPVGDAGDVYDRYLVRMEEMRQSIKIIRQALEKMPPGEMNVDSDTKVMLPKKEAVYNSIEGLIHQFEIIMTNRGPRTGKGEAYVPTESPNGELSFYVISNGGNGPYRFRVRPPSFYNYQILPKILEGRLLSDTVAIMSSLNIVAGEMDR
ncbi:NADH-quinone oxidoreductase subunit 4 [bacterium BMS3Abin05]|nr:NADH-quinone oxidoreductase subunit 4 [bacterium BMS3Abin05]GBE26212.1 NADH-quinone oxidoreductase subunit 4 [bacterium BMS3Bbin03]HDZ11389.1 NADH-quinone oxidoreductase subunit D [Bacteroidota bacterium]